MILLIMVGGFLICADLLIGDPLWWWSSGMYDEDETNTSLYSGNDNNESFADDDSTASTPNPMMRSISESVVSHDLNISATPESHAANTNRGCS